MTAASFVFCVIFTITNPAPAYFVTFGRMWQFGVGAMVALIPALRIRNAIGSFILGWAGIAVLVFVIFRFDGQTPFPGYAAALPTLAAAAVIAASNTERWWYPTRLLALRPAQFVGDISYSLYLWHWPLIIIAPSVPFWGLTIYHRVALLGLCFVLAWLTKRFVEDPARGWKVLTSRPVAGDPVVVARGDDRRRQHRGRRLGRQRTRLQRGRSSDPGAPREPARMLRRGRRARRRRAPTPSSATRSFPLPVSPASTARPTSSASSSSTMRAPSRASSAPTIPTHPRIALIGDSHAYQLLVDLPADGRRERLASDHVLQGCVPVEHDSAIDAGRVRRRMHRVARRRPRAPWRTPTSTPCSPPRSPRRRTRRQGYDSEYDAAVAGYREAWSGGARSRHPVVTVVDNPVWETDPNKCLRTRAMAECDGPRSELLVADDPLRDAASGVDGVTLLDFTDVFCDDDLCYPVVGGANVYRDQDHLTVTFTDTLEPWYTEAIQAALGG